MTVKSQVKKMATFLKSNYQLDFDQLPSRKLKDEVAKASNSVDKAYKLDIASDIKELLEDRHLNYEDRDFRIEALVEQFFLA